MDSFDDMLQFLDGQADIRKHGVKLPHWQQPGACTFVTFRLADSIPREKLEIWKEEREEWLERHPKPWNADTEQTYHRQFSGQVERWLDESHGDCVLREPPVAADLAEVLGFHEPDRYLHHSWVIMPNHVHLLFTLHPEESLEDRLKNWKGISARRINQRFGRNGKLWQRDYFDRLIRDGKHFRNVARYIRRNPEKARLGEGSYRLYESELVKAMLDDE
tara:strand:+ start:6658 stop:7314 length:657 start_codon:yes stop_codon:yes gene_type:complete